MVARKWLAHDEVLVVALPEPTAAGEAYFVAYVRPHAGGQLRFFVMERGVDGDAGPRACVAELRAGGMRIRHGDLYAVSLDAFVAYVESELSSPVADTPPPQSARTHAAWSHQAAPPPTWPHEAAAHRAAPHRAAPHQAAPDQAAPDPMWPHQAAPHFPSMAPVVSAPIAQKAGSGTKWAIMTAVGYFGTDNALRQAASRPRQNQENDRR